MIFKKGPEKVTVGGRAVIEGVTMRAPESIAIAVRRPDGVILVKEEFRLSVSKMSRASESPFYVVL